MKIVAEQCTRFTAQTAVVVKYDNESVIDARIVVRIETDQGALLAGVDLTHQEARAIGYALLAEADRTQKAISA